MPEKKLLSVSCAARAITRPTTPTPATKTPNSTLKVDKKFVRPNTIIRMDPIISRRGPYCVSDLPIFIQSDIKGTI